MSQTIRGDQVSSVSPTIRGDDGGIASWHVGTVSDIYLGWDVGAWHCDKNGNSRDALCALTARGSRVALTGTPWRGNLRDLLSNHSGEQLVAGLLDVVGFRDAGEHRVTIAIDTPLAWPIGLQRLVVDGVSQQIAASAASNPYLFRAQERALFVAGHTPLSIVTHMIGSQSTKGIHLLQQAGLKPDGIGIWTNRSRTVTAIETYPAVVCRKANMKSQTRALLAQAMSRGATWGKAKTDDVHDAIACAVVASLFALERDRLAPPGRDAEPAEGWIWLPS